MATNQMRREAAKRKLARQQERRAQQTARRRKVAVVTSAAVSALVVAGVVAYFLLAGIADEPSADPAAAAEPLALSQCAFAPTAAQPAAKPVPLPDITEAPTTGTVSIALNTSAGTIPLTLDRSKAPCTVASFAHLARNGFFAATPCHRLTTAGIKVLQCGDPSGTGGGGPGYSFPDETTPDLSYPRGTLAMANSGPDTNGSQFFMVYGDSPLPPQYTVFGTIGEPGLAVLDEIAAGGLADGAVGDGAPAQPVTIESVVVG